MKWKWSDNGLMKWKDNIAGHLKEFGRRVGKNIEEGQKGLKKASNKYQYRINPFKDVFKK